MDKSSELTYSFEQKEKLARRIQKLKKEKHFCDIQDIITKHNPEINITTNPSGHFMYFQNLRTETYFAIEKYIKKVTMGQFLSESSDAYSTQNTHSETKKDTLSESKKYSSEEEHFSSNPKLKYSNREKNLIKRKNYDKQINGDNQSSYYSSAGDTVLQDSDCHIDGTNSNTNVTTIITNNTVTAIATITADADKLTEKIFVKRKKNSKNTHVVDKQDTGMTLS
ncbi:MAG: hypothetical protein Terrestrivirus11_30 [Terrestrivirus sp.]|uniref:NET domain-containing protein n=1 Tax=Terrestrivirus sp. TaxID=2487775 RepID=A0A3G4ZTB5_9VIRU|nr:MAG: hypothetical protein Terrestrivirus11_30 [Terrestrivirus sp.]